jgi:hypothetical protein
MGMSRQFILKEPGYLAIEHVTLGLSHDCITVVSHYEFDRLQKFIHSRGQTLPVPGTALKAYGVVEVK